MSKECRDAERSMDSTAPLSRRHAITAIAAMPLLAQPAVADDAVAKLLKLSEESNAVLMRGDIESYRALVTYTSDFTLMSPFGGTPSRGADYTSETWRGMGRFFRNGTFKQEVVQAYGSADMVVL